MSQQFENLVEQAMDRNTAKGFIKDGRITFVIKLELGDLINFDIEALNDYCDELMPNSYMLSDLCYDVVGSEPGKDTSAGWCNGQIYIEVDAEVEIENEDEDEGN
jgi:hypothetical protein